MLTKLFTDYNFCLDWSIVFKLDISITHHPGKPLLILGSGEACLQICFRMITPVEINELFLKFILLSPITQEENTINFEFRRSKVMVTGQDCYKLTLYLKENCFCINQRFEKTLIWIHKLFPNTINVSFIISQDLSTNLFLGTGGNSSYNLILFHISFVCKLKSPTKPYRHADPDSF